MNPREATAVASAFWRRAGGSTPFPRSLEEPVLWALPVAVIKLPRLGLANVRSHLARVRVPCPFDGRDRAMRGCLVASRGEGLVFIDGTDSADEQRFSLAHEVSHFLLDYHLPRRQALDRLGPGIQPVLDGVRPPLPAERVNALFGGVMIRTYGHLMDRDWEGEVVHAGTLEAEDRADLVALELLAPRAVVLEAVSRPLSSSRDAVLEDSITSVLVTRFGLPSPVATRYAPLLAGASRPPRSFRQWLGLGRSGLVSNSTVRTGKRSAQGVPGNARRSE